MGQSANNLGLRLASHWHLKWWEVLWDWALNLWSLILSPGTYMVSEFSWTLKTAGWYLRFACWYGAAATHTLEWGLGTLFRYKAYNQNTATPKLKKYIPLLQNYVTRTQKYLSKSQLTTPPSLTPLFPNFKRRPFLKWTILSPLYFVPGAFYLLLSHFYLASLISYQIQFLHNCLLIKLFHFHPTL